jgi:formylglycine-generating enzyme
MILRFEKKYKKIPLIYIRLGPLRRYPLRAIPITIICFTIACVLQGLTGHSIGGNCLSQVGQFNEQEVRTANPPADVSITANNGTIVLSWTEIDNAASYKVEASDSCFVGFADVSANGVFTSQSGTRHWSVSATSAIKYYRVRSITDDIPSNFAFVEGGTFHNGTSWVSVSSFYMDKYELTQGAYSAIMGNDPAWECGDGENYPIYNVSWFNAVAYCNIRSVIEGLTPCYTMTGYGANPATWPPNWFNNYPYDSIITCTWTANGYRMPTEAEWEFAARGGNLSQGYTYSGGNTLSLVGWPSNGYPQNTHIGGGKAANELGLYDMSGNVWERCWDVIGNYPADDQDNPHGPGGSGAHVFRGGGIQSPPEQCTVSARGADLPHILNYTIGFRICRILP